MDTLKRSSRIIMTTEARVLKEMRMAKGLSLREAAALIHKSDSYIAHIENGRMDVPKGERLEPFLLAYGGMQLKSFHEKVRLFKIKLTPREELNELLSHISMDKIETLLKFAKTIAA